MNIEHLQRRYPLWRGASLSLQNDSLSTGYTHLDSALKIGGWPASGLLEMLMERPGIQELSLLMPAIAQHLKKEQRVAFVGMPYQLFPSTLRSFGISPQQVWCIQTNKVEEQLWATQQLLKSGHCLMVIAWQVNQRVAASKLRRLQVAAKDGKSCGVVFRHSQFLSEPSPAMMRVRLQGKAMGGLTVKVIKQPGNFSGQQVIIPNCLMEKIQLQNRELPVYTKDRDRLNVNNAMPSDNEAPSAWTTVGDSEVLKEQDIKDFF